MNEEQELLSALIQDSLNEAGLEPDEQTLAILSRAISFTTADGTEPVTRTVYGELESDGKAGKTSHQHQKNLLNLDLGDWIAIVSKTIPLTATGLYAASSPWQKVAVAFAGFILKPQEVREHQVRVAVQTDGQHVAALVKNGLGTVAMMEVDIQYRHAFGALVPKCLGGNSRVIEKAVASEQIGMGVMPRWAA